MLSCKQTSEHIPFSISVQKMKLVHMCWKKHLLNSYQRYNHTIVLHYSMSLKSTKTIQMQVTAKDCNDSSLQVYIKTLQKYIDICKNKLVTDSKHYSARKRRLSSV